MDADWLTHERTKSHQFQQNSVTLLSSSCLAGFKCRRWQDSNCKKSLWFVFFRSRSFIDALSSTHLTAPTTGGEVTSSDAVASSSATKQSFSIVPRLTLGADVG